MMLNELKNECNMATTENGAVTYTSTGSLCLDLFSAIGALRGAEEAEIVNRFIRAYTENPDTAMKILFFARDIRGGLGERKVFRIILNYLANYKSSSVIKNLHLIGEYGRYDDLICLLGTPCENAAVQLIKTQLENDIKNMNNNQPVSLLAKWLPSANTSNRNTVANAKRLICLLGIREPEYRKTLTALRAYIKIIENNLRKKDYSFNYCTVASKARFKYRRAFERNDTQRYNDFLCAVEKGKAKMHTDTLMPYEIIRPFFDGKALTKQERRDIDITWNNLPDFGNDENAIAVIDGSGSMYFGANPQPILIAMSLGIYFAEHNSGEFKNHFITFSHNPRLVEIKGNDIVEKLTFCKTYNEVANTNIQKVFELILKTAIKNKLPQEDMPKTLYFITDMEFDCCTINANLTNFEYAKKIFNDAGYALPKVVFWNVESRNCQQPVKMNEQGVALVSGCTPKLFEMVTGGKLSPYEYMLEIINHDRYKNIAA